MPNFTTNNPKVCSKNRHTAGEDVHVCHGVCKTRAKLNVSWAFVMYLNEKTLRFKSTQSKNAVMSHGSNGKKAILHDNNLYTITMQTLCTK